MMQKTYYLISCCLLAFLLPATAQDSMLAKLNGKWLAVKLSVRIVSYPEGQPVEAYETTDHLSMVKAGREVLTGIGFGPALYEADRAGAGERGVITSGGHQLIQLREQLPPELHASTSVKKYKWQVTGNTLVLETEPSIYRYPATGRFVQATFICTYSKN